MYCTIFHLCKNPLNFQSNKEDTLQNEIDLTVRTYTKHMLTIILPWRDPCLQTNSHTKKNTLLLRYVINEPDTTIAVMPFISPSYPSIHLRSKHTHSTQPLSLSWRIIEYKFRILASICSGRDASVLDNSIHLRRMEVPAGVVLEHRKIESSDSNFARIRGWKSWYPKGWLYKYYLIIQCCVLKYLPRIMPDVVRIHTVKDVFAPLETLGFAFFSEHLSTISTTNAQCHRTSSRPESASAIVSLFDGKPFTIWIREHTYTHTQTHPPGKTSRSESGQNAYRDTISLFAFSFVYLRWFYCTRGHRTDFEYRNVRKRCADSSFKSGTGGIQIYAVTLTIWVTSKILLKYSLEPQLIYTLHFARKTNCVCVRVFSLPRSLHFL